MGFCPGCYRRRPHCTPCGVLGRGHLSWSYGEVARKDAPGPSLWPCWPAGGCDNLMCSSCGTASDGCRNHQRQQQYRLWYPQWGDRRWCGTVASSTTIACAPCNAAINPPQLDAPPFVVEAATGIPLIDLTTPAVGEEVDQQPQEPISPDHRGPFTVTGKQTMSPQLWRHPLWHQLWHQLWHPLPLTTPLFSPGRFLSMAK